MKGRQRSTKTSKRSPKIRGKYYPQIYADEMQAAINGYSEKISEDPRETLPADLRRSNAGNDQRVQQKISENPRETLPADLRG